jgi:hypothetical protein
VGGQEMIYAVWYVELRGDFHPPSIAAQTTGRGRWNLDRLQEEADK